MLTVAFSSDAQAQNRREGYLRSERPDGEMHYIYFETIEDSLVRVRGGRAEEGSSVSMSAFAFDKICSELEAVVEPTGVDTISSMNVSLRHGTFRLSFARYLGPLLSLWGGLTVLLIGGLGWQGWRLRQSRRERERQEEARRQLETGRDQERRRIARDLHDGPLQEVLGLRMHMVASGDGHSAEERVGAELRRVARSLRAMSEDLNPPELEIHGLGAAMRAQAERLQERFPSLSVAFEEESSKSDGASGILPKAEQRALFRIGQEAMRNAAQHAAEGPRDINISARLRHSKRGATLEVVDNGTGFEPPADNDFSGFAREGHYGLWGMAERAELHGIDFYVTSELGAGTRVRASVSS